jgi:uncharacterized membrane protein YdbT with pleckstrin-like domain
MRGGILMSKKKIDGVEPIKLIWTDKKRILGMPISFTRYSLTEDRLFVKTGILNTVQEETLLYRVRDLSFKQSLWQRIFGVGTVIVHSSDKTSPHTELKNIKLPFEVKELLHKNVEKMKKENKVRANEFVTDADCDDD